MKKPINRDWSVVRGFNYQPSYGTNGLELWQNFDSSLIKHELGLGKKYFPCMNTVRYWLCHDAWLRNKNQFKDNFNQVLEICQKLDLEVMPVLFNRWHDPVLDYGGVYLDHFVAGTSWLQITNQLEAFTEDIVSTFVSDNRIFCWDLCNEPFAYLYPQKDIEALASAELDWLTRIAEQCRSLGATAPITVGIHAGDGLDGIRQVEPLCDVLSIHPYIGPTCFMNDEVSYTSLLDDYIDFSVQVNKPLIATEACWGSLNDTERVQIIKTTLGHLKQRKIGWLVYLLYESRIADAHGPELGPVGAPGNLAFIKIDGSLRAGHDVFNQY